MKNMKVKQDISKCKKEYCIKLANGEGWHIVATKDIGPWFNKLAGIMQLKVYNNNNYPKLILFKNGSNKNDFKETINVLNPKLTKGLPQDGWDLHDLGLVKLWYNNKTEDVICDIGNEKGGETIDIIRMWQAVQPIHIKEKQKGGIPIHAGLVIKDGYAVLLAAPGHTGKSTCCRRIPAPWKALSDDEALIVRTDKGKYLVHPFPTWSEYLWKPSNKTWDVEQGFPLKAIFFLKQAEIDKAVPVGKGQAAVFINETSNQIYRRSWRRLNNDMKIVFKEKLFQNTCELAKAVPSYILNFTRDGKFWDEIDKVLP